jgi:hypothetical protein
MTAHLDIVVPMAKEGNLLTGAVESGTQRVDMRTAEVGASAVRIPQVLEPSRDVQNRTPPI